MQRAVLPLAASPDLRLFLLEREILIDETSVDAVVAQGFDIDATARARQLVDFVPGFHPARTKMRSPPCKSSSAGPMPGVTWISPRCASWPSA